jgi:hypothetical protein
LRLFYFALGDNVVGCCRRGITGHLQTILVVGAARVLPQAHNFSYREPPKGFALSFVVAVEKLIHAATVFDLSIGFVGCSGAYFLGHHVRDFTKTAISATMQHLGFVLPETSYARADTGDGVLV